MNTSHRIMQSHNCLRCDGRSRRGWVEGVVLFSMVAALFMPRVVHGQAVSQPTIGTIDSIKINDRTDPWSGGVITVGGQVVIIPRNMIIELPANFLSLYSLFAEAPAECVALGESGLATEDQCSGGVGGVATILANRTAAGDVIAGDLFIEKGQELVTGSVTYIDHTDGYFRVNGAFGDPNTGLMVRINDPDGRHTIQQGLGCAGGPNCSADPRFTNDPDNYTVVFSTSYPACIPSTVIGGNRTVGSDADGFGDEFCPTTNRDATPVPDSTKFAPILLGDSVVLNGNLENIGGVKFLSVYDVLVRGALRTADDPTQPDYMIFDEVEWDVAGFQNERARALFIGFSTHPDSQLDLYSLHVDPLTNENHEVPIGSTVGNPLTINQGIGAANLGIFKIRYDIDFFLGAPVRDGLSPCENLQNAGFGVCPAVSDLVPDFSIISPITREMIGRTRQKVNHPELIAYDITGSSAPWGEYLTPVGIGHPEFVEINLDAISTPFIFAGEPWNLDRRLSPAGCIDTDGVVNCESTPQPLDPFPFSGLDPRTQAAVPFGARDRIMSAWSPLGPATVALDWPPVDPPAINAVANPLDITRATFKEEIDCTKIDVWATSDLSGDLVVTGAGLSPHIMTGDGSGSFFAHISVPIPAVIPTSITVTQTETGATADRVLVDEVAIVQVTYDVTTQSMTVQGASSSAVGASSLALETGETTGPGGDVVVTGVAVPPETITLTSSRGGSETRQVIVSPTLPDTLSVTSAVFDQDVARWTILGTSTVPGPGHAVLAYLGEPIMGTLIEAGEVDAFGNWTIVTADGSPADPNASGAPATISVQSIPLGGVLEGVSFVKTGTPPALGPAANAGPDQLVPLGSLVQLDGSGSTGTFSTYHWVQVNGPAVTLSNPDIAMPEFVFPASPAGIVLTFSLTVSGSEGDSNDIVIISSFNPATDVPVARSSVAQTSPIPPDPTAPPSFPTVQVQLAGADSLGQIDTFSWAQTSGPPVVLGEVQLDGTILPDPTIANPAFRVITEPGDTVLNFELTVSGPLGSDTTPLTVTLTHVTPDPVADAGLDQIVGAGDRVTLNGLGSVGDGLTYHWEQIGGPLVGGPPWGVADADAAVTVFFYPGLPEPLVFELTVTDLFGATSTDTITFFRAPRFPEPSLKTVPVPEPPNLADFVKDKAAAIALGKSLFWDMQTGGDGLQACASCHYHAGADHRFRNTINPGSNGAFEVGGPNHELTLADFPIGDDDVIGSQGVVRTAFDNIVPGRPLDDGTLLSDPVHSVGGLNTRQVTGRQAPPVINAIFNARSFSDGRANFVFNGVNPFGRRDPNGPTVLEVLADGSVDAVSVELEQASLASQAVGPPNNGVEMSWDGRSFAELARKLFSLRPLALQEVAPTDSVLGGMVDASGTGLNTTYDEMVRAAFHERWWDSTVTTPDGYSVMESNFSLFMGLAIQCYEATLVSDDAPYDRWREGDETALTQQQKDGLQIFLHQGLCYECHTGPEFTGATVSKIIVEDPVEHMMMADQQNAMYDNAFYNIGVRPTSDDIGVGGTDPFGNPLSFTKLSQNGVVIGPPMLFEPIVEPSLRTALNGAFKTSSLRNIELTGPYMHNGGFATLEQVVNFYSRGGDFIEENIDDADLAIRPLAVTQQDKADLVAFLKSLTDERVRYQRPPFDHPQLFVSNGHVGDVFAVSNDGSGVGVNHLKEIPATGAAGGDPLEPFVVPEALEPFGPNLAPLGACCTGGGVCQVTDSAGCPVGNWVEGQVCGPDVCPTCSTDADCDDGLFCNGAEICDAVIGCIAGSDPCPGEACDETAGACDLCPDDPDKLEPGACGCGVPEGCSSGPITIPLDISPNQQPNYVVLSLPYTIYVTVLGGSGFDPATMDPGVKFGPTGTEASPVFGPMSMDINFDGNVDALYFFSTPQCGFSVGDTVGIFKGTAGGVDVEGSDSVFVLP